MARSGPRDPFLNDESAGSLSMRSEGESVAAPAASEISPEGRTVIMVVDDNALERGIISDHLAPLEYEIIEARNGDEALARLDEVRPDLVLLDVVMPGMDGFEVCRRLKGRQDGRLLPVLLVTSRDDIRSKISGFEHGADDYITKPIHPAELLVRVQSMLRIKRLEETLGAEKSRVEIQKRKIERVIEGMRDSVIIVGSRDEVTLNPAAQMTFAALLDDPNCDYATLCRVLTFDPRKSLEAKQDDKPSTWEIVIGDDEYGALISEFPHFGGHARPSRPEGGDASRRDSDLVIVLRNITREKALERSRTEFISYVSHELRTPLTSLKNAISIILSGKAGELQPDLRKFVSIADRNARRLVSLINDLLDLARLESGKRDMQFALGQINEPIEASIASLAGHAEAKRLRIERNIAADVPLVYTHSTRIEQVVTNLLGNAVKFSPEGGTITISVRALDSTPERAPDLGFEVKKYVQVTVEDQGKGIPGDQVETVFDKFHVLHEGHSGSGTGLGLPIAKNLVEAHGGAIWAESKVTKGARVSFVLPVLSDENSYHFILRSTIDRCKRSQGVMSVVVIRLEGGIASRTEEGAEALNATFEEVYSIVSKAMEHPQDTVFPFRMRREINILLRDVPKAAAFKILGDLEKTLVDLSSQGKNFHAQFGFGVASYPEDGVSGPELESHLSLVNARVRVLGEGEQQLDLDPFSELEVRQS